MGVPRKSKEVLEQLDKGTLASERKPALSKEVKGLLAESLCDPAWTLGRQGSPGPGTLHLEQV